MDVFFGLILACTLACAGGLAYAIVRENDLRRWTAGLVVSFGFLAFSVLTEHPVSQTHRGHKAMKSDEMESATAATAAPTKTLRQVIDGVPVVNNVVNAAQSAVSAGTSSYNTAVKSEAGMMCFDSKDQLASYETIYGNHDNFVTKNFMPGELTVPFGTSLRVVSAETSGQDDVVTMKVVIQDGPHSGSSCWAIKSAEN